MPYNDFQQAIGHFTQGSYPQIDRLTGYYTIVEPVSVEDHLDDAYRFYGPDSVPEQWTYLPIDGFKDIKTFQTYFEMMETSRDPYYLAIKDKATQKVLGTFSLMRIDTKNRLAEMGWVLYSPQLKQSRQATEAQFLVMAYVFDVLHYRRYEWKCDSLNHASVHAAKRLGFQYEGTFRKAAVYKQRSRDTAWFSMIDDDWHSMKAKFEKWLLPTNFDDQGRQLKPLGAC
ncbi:GNAT family N-acetyltransferase [Streptococcus sp. H31]|uniref:GNAT family N-acetyltransferase n=1 Tax=Streptococcus huangxiaojuni TaxID=3237239 RepID=UPI0034A4BDAC